MAATTRTLISTLIGPAGNAIGNGGVKPLANGNYLILSPSAVTFGNGMTGVSGVVSAANSLITGATSITVLSNGNYVVSTSNWSNGTHTNAGAVTFCNGTTGTFGMVSAANSLVGTTTNDQVGVLSAQIGSSGVIALPNGNYLVESGGWHNAGVATGAVTFVNGNNRRYRRRLGRQQPGRLPRRR